MSPARRKWLLLLLVCVLPGGASLATADPAPAKPFALVGADIFDGSGAPPITGVVVVEGGRIVSVTPGRKAPAGVRRVDARGLALLPGLYDLHTHFTPAGEPASAADIRAAYLAAGVTTVQDFHSAPEAFAARRSLNSQAASPNVRYAARISTTGGHGADWADQQTTRWVNTAHAARLAVAEVAAYKPDIIKVFADGWRYGSGVDNSSMDEPTLTALVADAHGRGIKVATHTVSVERGRVAARAGVDLIAHSLQDAAIDPDTAVLMKASGVAYAATLAVYEPDKPGRPILSAAELERRRARYRLAEANLRTLAQAGVVIALGTDAGMPATPHGVSTLRELELMEAAGLTPVRALVAATSGSARAIGDAGGGCIASGCRADFVLVRGQPWERVSDMRKVMRTYVGGRVVHDADRPVKAEAPDRIVAGQPPLVLADFERVDGRTAAGALPVTDIDAGKERSVAILSRVAAAAGGHALRLTAWMARRPDPWADLVIPLAPGGVQPVDLSSARGLSFRASADGPVRLAVITSGGEWVASLPLSPEPVLHTISFATLTPPVAGMPWSGGEVMSIRLRISRTAGETGWVEVDDLALVDAVQQGQPKGEL